MLLSQKVRLSSFNKLILAASGGDIWWQGTVCELTSKQKSVLQIWSLGEILEKGLFVPLVQRAKASPQENHYLVKKLD